MRGRLRSLEQLMPFATAGELIEQKGRAVISVSPGMTARDALREMEAHDIGFLPVLDDTKLTVSCRNATSRAAWSSSIGRQCTRS